MQPKAIFTVGLSGSGKTTWAMQQIDYVVVSRDDFRVKFMVEQGKEFTWSSWNWKNEDAITERVNEYVDHLIVQGQNIIFADTNLNKDRLDNAIAKIEASTYQATVKYFLDVPLETCVKQDLNRRHSVGRDVIQKQWRQAMDNHGGVLPFLRYSPDQSLADNFNVVAAIDDRKQVLELWTNLGIQTIDVGNIYERF